MGDEKILNLPWDLLSFFLNRARVSPFSGSYSFWAEIYHLIDKLILLCTVQKSLGGSGSCKCSKARVSSWHNFMQLGVSCLNYKDASIFRRRPAPLSAWRIHCRLNNRVDHLRETNLAGGPRDGQTGLQLLDILRESQNPKCTLTSDKIYGVLDLSTDKDTFEEPDYNLDPAEVFTTAYLTTRRSCDPLYCCAKSNEKSDVSLPS